MKQFKNICACKPLGFASPAQSGSWASSLPILCWAAMTWDSYKLQPSNLKALKQIPGNPSRIQQQKPALDKQTKARNFQERSCQLLVWKRTCSRSLIDVLYAYFVFGMLSTCLSSSLPAVYRKVAGSFCWHSSRIKVRTALSCKYLSDIGGPNKRKQS